MNTNDSLGTCMKEFYEDRTRIKLPRRSYVIIRIDGKAFHTYTKGLERPFDQDLIDDMNATTAFLCKNIQGAKFGYVQSDEISLVLTDFDDLSTHAWFDNNLQKIVSVAASMATSEFNRLRTKRYFQHELFFKHNAGSDEEPNVIIKDPNFLEYWPKQAQFDARAFTISSLAEVENYFIWRQQDAVRNSISSVAQSLYSPKELNGVKTNQMQDMIFQKGINWNDYPARLKRGSVIRKFRVEINEPTVSYSRNKWQEDENTPVFTQDREYIKSLLPTLL